VKSEHLLNTNAILNLSYVLEDLLDTVFGELPEGTHYPDLFVALRVFGGDSVVTTEKVDEARRQLKIAGQAWHRQNRRFEKDGGVDEWIRSSISNQMEALKQILESKAVALPKEPKEKAKG
jgi:hypothetical protein